MHALSPNTKRLAHSLSRLAPATEAPAVAGATPPLLRVLGADLVVPLVTGESVRYVNLDYASSAPCLEVVAAAVQRLLPWCASVHRGAGFASAVMGDAFDAARGVVGAFVGAGADDAVVFTRNTTDALNLLAAALPEDTTVVSFLSEHHANLLPWRRRGDHVLLPVTRTGDDAVARAEGALKHARGRHKLLAVTGASNVTGEVWPLRAFAEVARRHGARLAVDAAQLAPHRPIDLARDGVDFVAFSGHKLYAPFGAGALVGRRDWLDAAHPYLVGGGAVTYVGEHDVGWAHGPARHEAGTPNAVGAVALAAACEAVRDVGWGAMLAHEEALLAQLREGLEAIGGVDVLSIWEGDGPRIGAVTFNLRGHRPDLLATALNAEFGIGLRQGAFCAHPLAAALAARTGDAPGGVRASFGVGTRETDIARLLVALGTIRDQGVRWRYRDAGGRLAPDPDPRVVPSLVTPARTGRGGGAGCVYG